ncbi:MAG: hypothetical protein DMG19_19370, partial [Acidobacteria bacterium]
MFGSPYLLFLGEAALRLRAARLALRGGLFLSVSASAIMRTAPVTRTEFVSIIWVASAYRGERSD